MKNIKALVIACTVTYIFLVSFFAITLLFWSQESIPVIDWISYFIIPLIFISGGYLATSLSTKKQWWFGLILGVTSYILLLLLVNLYDYYIQGDYFVVISTGALGTAAIMTGMGALGGVVYKIKHGTP